MSSKKNVQGHIILALEFKNQSLRAKVSKLENTLKEMTSGSKRSKNKNPSLGWQESSKDRKGFEYSLKESMLSYHKVPFN